MPDDSPPAFDYAAFWWSVGAAHASADPLGAVCWDGAPSWFNSFFASLQVRAVERALTIEFGRVRRAGRALDIGAGTGRWTRQIARWWSDPIALDLSHEMLASRTQYRRVQADITRLPFAPVSFDFAMSVTVIQHLPYELQVMALHEAARVLRPGARLVMLEMIRDIAPRAHVFPRSIDGWTAALHDGGFEVTSLQGEAYVPLVRLGARGARQLRLDGSKTEIDRVKLGDADEPTSASISRMPALSRWAARAAIAASYPFERAAEAVAPATMATHACIVARRR